MLARPFQAMSRTALLGLLALLILLELALGTGVYMSGNKGTAAVATPTPQGRRYCSPSGRVTNSPRTVLIGQYETFAVCLKDLPGQILTYTLSYPDGTSEMHNVLSDRSGYSKLRFKISYKPQGSRDSVGIGVSFGNRSQINTRFAVQNPNYGKPK